MSEEFISEISEELETMLPPHYKLDRDKLEITRVCGVLTIKDFEELATILPSFYKLELTDDKIVIMLIHNRTGMLFFVEMSTNVSFPCLNYDKINSTKRSFAYITSCHMV